MPQLDVEDQFCAALEDDVAVPLRMPRSKDLIGRDKIRSDKITWIKGFTRETFTQQGKSGQEDYHIIEHVHENLCRL